MAIAVLFALMLWQRKSLAPNSWIAIVVTGFFQTTINFASTTMAVFTEARAARRCWCSPCRSGRCSSPGRCWANAFAAVNGLRCCSRSRGLMLVVEPWNWHDAIRAETVGGVVGLRLGGGHHRDQVFSARQASRHAELHRLADDRRRASLLLLPFIRDTPPVDWSPVYVAMLAYSGAIATGFGFVLWIAVLRFLPAGTAALNMLAIPAIALVSSMMIFDERLNATEWTGIALIASGW